MEAISSITKGVLAPAGNPISTQKHPLEQPLVDGYQAIYTDSGTSALALALATCKLSKENINAPEVLIPGYGCPDLIAAAIYAGVKPIIVDTDLNSPFYNVKNLSNSLTRNTIAILAVNFLGISENISAIQETLKKTNHSAIIIEDNAQWLPEGTSPPLSCDLSIISFGRGKPLNLLGGGALLYKKDTGLHPTKILPTPFSPRSSLVDTLKIHFYNQLIKPFNYQLLARNPLLNLGQTAYHPLKSIQPLSSTKRLLIANNLELYRKRSRLLEQQYLEILRPHKNCKALTSSFPKRYGRLLRFPVLCHDKSTRDQLLERSNKIGLGFSAMYQTGINQIKSLPSGIHFPNLTNSNDFAEKLLTLPLHTHVTSKHLDLIASALKNTP